MPVIDPKNTDAALIVVFKNHPIYNEAKSANEGRPIFDDLEICEIRAPGRRDWQPFPATAVSDWVVDPITGAQTKRTYAERFAHQYRQFKERQHQTVVGTPLDYATFLTEGERASYRALNLYTIEQLAHIDGQDLKNLGVGGREHKNRAIEYLDDAKTKSADTMLRRDNEALRARLAVVEADNEALKRGAPPPTVSTSPDSIDDMTDEQLRQYITTHSGHAPQGNLPRKTLVQMAQALRPKEIKAA